MSVEQKGPILAAAAPAGKEVLVKRTVPDGLPLEFADSMMIRNLEGGVFVLYFLQTRTPLAITPAEVAAVDSVDAVCFSQIVVTADQLKKIMDAMAVNYQKYLDKLTPSGDITKEISE